MRRSQREMAAAAAADLSEALGHLGLKTRPARLDGGADLVVSLDGREVPVKVQAAAVLSPGRVASLPKQAADGGVSVVVADAMAGVTKEALHERGWGWFERRRGHLALRGGGLFIDHAVPMPDRPDRTHSDPITGRAGLAFAAALLMNPNAPPSIRTVATQAGMAPSTIGEAALKLRRASLVKEDGSPLVPELFWELVAAWPTTPQVALRQMPDDAVLFRAGRDRAGGGEREDLGFALTGTAAALAYDAPVVVAGDVPPDFLVPDAAAVAGLRRSCGVADSFDSRACTVAVAPTRLACATPVSLAPKTPWPVAHPLFVALDLAQDSSRGQEILEELTPPEGFSRVW